MSNHNYIFGETVKPVSTKKLFKHEVPHFVSEAQVIASSMGVLDDCRDMVDGLSEHSEGNED